MALSLLTATPAGMTRQGLFDLMKFNGQNGGFVPPMPIRFLLDEGQRMADFLRNRKMKTDIPLNLYLAGESVPRDPSCVLAFVQQRGETCNGYDWTLAHYIKRGWMFCDQRLDAKRVTVVFWIDLPKTGEILTNCKSSQPTQLLDALLQYLRERVSATFSRTNRRLSHVQARKSLSCLLASVCEDRGSLLAFVDSSKHPGRASRHRQTSNEFPSRHPVRSKLVRS